MLCPTSRTPIADLSAALPAEIDAQLARIWEETYAVLDQIMYFKRQVEEYDKGLAIKTARQPGWLQYSCYTEAGRDRCQKELDGYRARLRTLEAEAAPYEAEFARRGGWTRFFKVINGNGHVHRSQHCTSCFPTTRYAWLYNLSGATDDAVIAEWGHVACSQDCCFPDAPVEEMRRAHEAALYCPGSGREASAQWRAGRGFYGRCSGCSKAMKLTTVGALPKHKPAPGSKPC